jgi:hypothetical protein
VEYQLATVYEEDGVTPRVVEMDTVMVPLYQIQRLVNGVPIGQSAPFITFFDIDLLGPTGAMGVPPSGATQVRVRFSMAVGSGMQTSRRTYLRETHWGTTIPISE